MIKDSLLKAIFIPLLAILLPVLSGIINYKHYSLAELTGINLLFLLSAFIIWTGANWIHVRFRPLYKPIHSIGAKLLLVCTVSLIYSATAASITSLLWMEWSREVFAWIPIFSFITYSVVAAIFLTLVYEILFLSKEKEIESAIINQLDFERSQAEWQALSNEVDPHFLFNSLNALNHLIRTNPPQALEFNNRLASVYKYILINNRRDLVTLEDELEFINSYFYLLQTRHDDKLKLSLQLRNHSTEVFLPPLSLQLLVENAIKHNKFSEKEPLTITITSYDDKISVSNKINKRAFPAQSTKIGLQNLNARFRLLNNSKIEINDQNSSFTVTIPLLPVSPASFITTVKPNSHVESCYY